MFHIAGDTIVQAQISSITKVSYQIIPPGDTSAYQLDHCPRFHTILYTSSDTSANQLDHFGSKRVYTHLMIHTQMNKITEVNCQTYPAGGYKLKLTRSLRFHTRLSPLGDTNSNQLDHCLRFDNRLYHPVIQANQLDY